MKRTNILLITTDQMRWDCVGINGNKNIKTPNLNKMAEEGVNFNFSFSAAAACQPSRASLITGVYPHTHGVNITGATWWTKRELPTLPGLLSQNGYTTIGVGKMHFYPWDAKYGFDERIIIESKYFYGEDEYRKFIKNNNLQNKVIGHHTPDFGKFFKAIPSKELSPSQHIDGFIGGKAIGTLKKLINSKEHPFFLWVSFCGPHDPYDPPQPYASMYKPENMPLPKRRKEEHKFLPPAVREKSTDFGREHLNLWGLSDKEIQRIRALYYGNISLIDDYIGKLLEIIEGNKIDENTIIIFTSDHGDYLGDHDLFWKGILPSDSDMKVPLILKWKNNIKKYTCNEFVSGVDIFPTILKAAGIKTPEINHGINLFDIIKNKRKRDFIVMFSEPNKWRYRDKKWAYTYWPDQPFDTLYNLEDDPYELFNLEKENSEMCNFFKQKLKNWFKDFPNSPV